MRRWIVLMGMLLLTGCASALPEKTFVAPEYSLKGAQMMEVRITCNDVEASDVRATFIRSYCKSLRDGFKLALKDKFPKLHMVEAGGDLVMDLTLEQLHGGSDTRRFWIGFGAGRSVSTAYLKMLKGGQVIAEKRFVETTTMPDLLTGASSNEEALMRDIPLLTRKMMDFVDRPE
ncbi:MAG: hypothetical protein OEM27_06415 [Nitrospinota bacterium]|nr:hypothetical protein [Nitrospinota bacterium]